MVLRWEKPQRSGIERILSNPQTTCSTWSPHGSEGLRLNPELKHRDPVTPQAGRDRVETVPVALAHERDRNVRTRLASVAQLNK
jgi:hypothetical protein